MTSRIIPFASVRLSMTSCSGNKFRVASSKMSFHHFCDLREKLRKKFEEKMKNSQVELFSDFDVYAKFLPVCEFMPGQLIKLHEQPYFAHPEDISQLAYDLALPASRPKAIYMCSPSGTGKSASILPAFLASDKFTHYVYIACANNGNCNFSSGSLLKDSDKNAYILAEQQGAAFMVECVQKILNKPEHGKHKICAKEPMLVSHATKAIEKLLEPLGEGAWVLFHIDEHQKMCERDGDFARTGEEFSRGALEALIQEKSSIAIATFTEPLDSFPGRRCSGTTRLPLPVPCLDVNALMEKVPELKFSPDSLEKANKTQKALFANLQFRLGIKMTSEDYLLPAVLLGMKMTPDEINLLSDENSIKKAKQFLMEFECKKQHFENMVTATATATTTEGTDALRECVTACEFQVTTQTEPNKNAARFLRGVCDEDIEEMGLRQAEDLVVLSDSQVSVSLPHLLSWKDEKIAVYEQGRDLMRQVLTANNRNLSIDTPLERAYLWALSCKAAMRGKLRFGDWFFLIFPKKLQAGRIFPSNVMENPQTEGLRPEVFYYVDKNRDGKRAHPLADLFFVTSENQLVLIDITDTVEEAHVHEKFESLEEYISDHKKKLNKYELFGVVLAPCLSQELPLYLSEDDPTFRVCVLTNNEAQQQLGGLRQVFRCMMPKQVQDD